MIAYLLIGFLSVFLCYFSRNKKLGLQWAFVFITVFLSIRYMWGSDYPAYLGVYNNINGYGVSGLDLDMMDSFTLRHNEYGWYFLNRGAGLLHIGFFGLVIITSIFECWVVYRIISKYTSPSYYWVAILIWVFTASSFCVNASMMRQYLSMCMYLIVMDLMIENRNKKNLIRSIVIILIAATVHRSALVMLITLPFYYVTIKPNKSSYIGIALLALLFVVWKSFGRSIVEPYLLLFLESSEDFSEYMRYIGQENTGQTSTGIGVIINYIMFATWLFFLPRFDRKRQPFVIMLIGSYFFGVIADIAPLAGRLGLYLSFTSMICWASLYEMARKNKALYFVLALELAMILRTLPAFFFSDLWRASFLHYHTIFSAPTWM